MLKGKMKDLYNFITTRMKATYSEKKIILKFLENVEEEDEIAGKKPIERSSFKAIWRLFRLIELAPNEAERLLKEVKSERWFDREVVKSLRGKVLNLNESKKDDEEEEKKRKSSPLPSVIKQGGGIIVPFTTTVNTGQTPSLGPVNIFSEETLEEMSVYEALRIANGH